MCVVVVRNGSISVSGQLLTYPSPNQKFTLTYELVRGGVGVQLQQLLNHYARDH